MLASTALPKATGKGPTWAYMASITPPLSLARKTSKSSSGSSAGATAQELKEDREVTVKVGDGQMIESLRKKAPTDLLKMANDSRQNAAYKLQSAPLDAAQVVAAKQLKSGNIKL